MEWYYAKDGKPVGPVSAEELLEIARTGELAPRGLVWNETFGDDWRAAGSVPELAPWFGPEYAGPLPSAAGGTGGTTPNGELTRSAREALAGNWGTSIGILIVAGLLLAAASALSYGILSWLLQGSVALGFSAIFLSVSRGGPATFAKGAEGFSRFGSALGLFLWQSLFLFLWSVAALVPAGLLAVAAPVALGLGPQLRGLPLSGRPPPVLLFALGPALLLYVAVMVVIQLRYALAFFALADDPSLGPRSALRRSIEWTRGRKGKLFGLYCRFIGWGILSVLSCGLGFLWLFPYVQTATARFYDDIRPPA